MCTEFLQGGIPGRRLGLSPELLGCTTPNPRPSNRDIYSFPLQPGAAPPHAAGFQTEVLRARTQPADSSQQNLSQCSKNGALLLASDARGRATLSNLHSIVSASTAIPARGSLHGAPRVQNVSGPRRTAGVGGLPLPHGAAWGATREHARARADPMPKTPESTREAAGSRGWRTPVTRTARVPGHVSSHRQRSAGVTQPPPLPRLARAQPETKPRPLHPAPRWGHSAAMAAAASPLHFRCRHRRRRATRTPAAAD